MVEQIKSRISQEQEVGHPITNEYDNNNEQIIIMYRNLPGPPPSGHLSQPTRPMKRESAKNLIGSFVMLLDGCYAAGDGGGAMIVAPVADYSTAWRLYAC